MINIIITSIEIILGLILIGVKIGQIVEKKMSDYKTETMTQYKNSMQGIECSKCSVKHKPIPNFDCGGFIIENKTSCPFKQREYFSDICVAKSKEEIESRLKEYTTDKSE